MGRLIVEPSPLVDPGSIVVLLLTVGRPSSCRPDNNAMCAMFLLDVATHEWLLAVPLCCSRSTAGPVLWFLDTDLQVPHRE